jgi:hypothetical protein
MRVDNNRPHLLFAYTDTGMDSKNHYPQLRITILRYAHADNNYVCIPFYI